MKQKPEDKADWWSIALHFVMGFLVGAGFILLGMTRAGRLYKNSGGLVIILILAGGMVSGCAYGLYQNELWLKDSASIIPPLPAQHSRISKIVLISLMGLSLVAAVLAVVWLKAWR